MNLQKIPDEQLRKKVILDLDILRKISEGYQLAGHTVVCTIGSFDGLHIGHARYLRSASRLGDIFVVGFDSDATIKKYKGDHRPMYPEIERAEMLTQCDFVDFVTPVSDVDENGNWQYELIKHIQPDVFVCVEDSYPPEQRAEIERYCKKLEMLPRQAEGTSSSQVFEKMKTLEPTLLDVILDQRGMK